MHFDSLDIFKCKICSIANYWNMYFFIISVKTKAELLKQIN